MNTAKVTRIKATKSSKVQLEIRDEVKRITEGPSLLSIANKSDDRFSGNKRQVMWFSGEPADLTEMFPNLSDEIAVVAETKEHFDLEQEKEITFDGQPCKIRIVEDHTASNDWEVENLNRAVKKAGSDGYLIKEVVDEETGEVNNMLIFSRKQLVVGEPDHQLVQHDEIVSSFSGTFYRFDDKVFEAHVEDYESVDTEIA